MQKYFLTVLVACVALAGGVIIKNAWAGTSHNIIGNWPNWTGEDSAGVWGGTPSLDGAYRGMGWVSMNSLDCDTDGDGTIDYASCGGGGIADYGVNVPLTDGNLSGYAWNSEYGWISFNAADLGGCPSGACVAERVGNSIKGWARILAIKNAYEAVPSNSGGWQGWISLSKTPAGSLDYGVTLTGVGNRELAGFAWSNELGWLRFNGARVNVKPKMTVCPSSHTMARNQTRSFIAYYDPSGIGASCLNPGSAQNVTGDVTWTSSDPAAVSVAAGVVTALQAGVSVTITVGAYNDADAVQAAVDVTGCVPTLTCSSPSVEAETDRVCPIIGGGTFNTGMDNGCGVSLDCPGTRYCDYNWKEIAPQ